MATFPHRLIAASFQFAVVLFEHLPPIVAAAVFFVAVVAVVAVSVAVPWQTARLVVRVWRRDADRRALAELNREYADLCNAYSPNGPTGTSGAEHLPGVTRIGPATPPPVRPKLRRRRMPSVRIPRRHVRHTTTSSSDRSSRS